MKLMNLQNNRLYFKVLIMMLFSFSGFCQTSCYKLYEEENEVLTCINVFRYKTESVGQFSIETSNSFLYRSFPNFVRISSIKECLYVGNATIYKTILDSIFVIVPNGIKPVIIHLLNDSIEIPVRSIPQVQLKMQYNSVDITEKDSIPLDYIRQPEGLVFSLYGSSQTDSCMSAYLDSQYKISEIVVFHIRNGAIINETEGYSTLEIFSSLNKDVRINDVLLIKVVVRINEQSAKNRLFRLVVE